MSDILTVAVVGNFGGGKSSLVNALLGRNVAKMGRGLSTTHENSRPYSLSPAVSVIDTPGFDANGEDDGTAASAIDKSNVVIYVHENKSIGKICAYVFKRVREQGKKMIFLMNCCDETGNWSPDENGDIVETIEAELENMGLESLMIPLSGHVVIPINILWARFGLGLMDPVSQGDTRKIRKICKYAEDPLGISVRDDALRAEMLRRSGFIPVREFLRNLPLELLKHAVANPEREINRIVDRFAEEFKKRWNAA